MPTCTGCGAPWPSSFASPQWWCCSRCFIEAIRDRQRGIETAERKMNARNVKR